MANKFSISGLMRFGRIGLAILITNLITGIAVGFVPGVLGAIGGPALFAGIEQANGDPMSTVGLLLGGFLIAGVVILLITVIVSGFVFLQVKKFIKPKIKE